MREGLEFLGHGLGSLRLKVDRLRVSFDGDGAVRYVGVIPPEDDTDR